MMGNFFQPIRWPQRRVCLGLALPFSRFWSSPTARLRPPCGTNTDLPRPRAFPPLPAEVPAFGCGVHERKARHGSARAFRSVAL
jgi:hypothetical protein